jgi:hypothetical protein
MTHFPTLHAMERRRNVKHTPTPPPKPVPQRPASDAGVEAQRDERQPITREE